MKLLVLTLGFALMPILGLCKDGSLYIVPIGENGDASIEEGKLVWRFEVERQQITKAILRFDTEDRSLFWLELHLTKQRDPGDYIVHFEPASEKHWQFNLMGAGENAQGSKWAMRFEDIAAAKAALKAVAQAYALGDGKAQDKTRANKSE